MDKKEYNHNYAQKNHDRILQLARKYRQKHKEELSQYREKYYRENKGRLLKEQREKRQELKRSILALYSNSEDPKCVRCGITDVDILCVDHIENNGNKHRRQLGVGWDFYAWLKRNGYPEGYQTLCFNCNMKKRREHEKVKVLEAEEER